MELLGMTEISSLSLLGIITALTLAYWYFTRTFNYWKSRGIPYAKPYPFFGSMGGFAFKPFHTEELKRRLKYGKVYGGFNGPIPYLSVGDPDMLKQIMVKDFGVFTNRKNLQCGEPLIDNMVVSLKDEDWKRVRNILTPIFTSGKLKRLYYIVEDSTEMLCSHFKESANKNTPIDVTKFFGAFTMDVILSTAFGTKINSLNDNRNPLVRMAQLVFRDHWRTLLFFVSPTLMNLLHVPAFNPEATGYLNQVILQMIKERKETGKRREDFLQMVLDASKEAESQDVDMKENVSQGEKNGEPLKYSPQTKGLSTREIESQCVLFLAAAYDTTAVALSYAAFNLALNPECQEKLIKEIDATFAKTDKKTLDYDVVQNLEYLDCVVSETIRLYPPAILTNRVSGQKFTFKDRGITIDKGIDIHIPVYANHHDPDFFPEPEKFIPERFAPENKSNIRPYTYIPFGGGPRNCIGMRFALMEMKICLANVFRRFRFKRCAETKVPGDFLPGVLISPKSVMLKVETRKDIPSA